MQDCEEVKLVLIGNQSVGKTCIVRMATTGLFDEDTIATLGASYTSKTIVMDSKEVRIQIWDTAGQERYRSMTPMYYRGAQFAFVVYSVDNMESFQSVDQWMESLRECVEDQINVFVVANKADLEDARAVTAEQGQEKAKQFGATFMEVSAKTGMGIEDLFTDLTKVYLEKQKANGPAESPKSLDINSKTAPEKKGKCCK